MAVKRVKDGLTPGVAAKELGVNHQTLRNWIKAAEAGKLNGAGTRIVTPEQMGLCVTDLWSLFHLQHPLLLLTQILVCCIDRLNPHIEADTADSAIVNLTTKTYDTGGTLTVTEQDRYRITGLAALVPVSTDIQNAGGSPAHLVWTYN